MRIFCWNVNGLLPTLRNIKLKHGSLGAFFEHLNADIVCMQEVKLPDAKLSRELVAVAGYQSYWSCSEGKTGYSGVTTWAREGCAAVSAVADCLLCPSCEREGRVVLSDHGSFVLLNVYVPNAGARPERPRLAAKLEFLAAVKRRVDELLAEGRQVIAVGDFNVAAGQRDVHEALGWADMYADEELAALYALLSSVPDTWRRLHPDTDGTYTVWNERTSARSFNVGQRIDYVLCSPGLQGCVRSCDVLLDLPPKWSDHAPLLLELQLPGVEAATAAAAAAAGTSQPAPACPMWQQLLKRFQDPSQRSIAAMFKAAKPRTARQEEEATAVDDAAPAAAGAAAETAAKQEQQPQLFGPSFAAAGSAKRSRDVAAADTAVAADDGSKGDQRACKTAKRVQAGDNAAAAACDAAAAAAVPEQKQQRDNTPLEPRQQEQQQQQQQEQRPSAQQTSRHDLTSTGGHSAPRSTSSSTSSKLAAAAKPSSGGKQGQRSKAAAAAKPAEDPTQMKLSAFFAARSRKPDGGS